ncbi:hypothetical protein G3480_16020 [Thiorhodococcus mannitoliphagus]|uniref:Uncharacterized protein n=1 Tax=Thiorhodococcus mannitoliphagus TaxID=329406 RepID=A0A6P1DUN5_9GAMM|nr:hypothetical protein [Thiorhodococcus mannitoliphagus]NEX21798.1 hypothetical protein [Thiorhodococcus mannitoliphagus]
MGFAPRADVLFENAETNRRVWIEFEISRADPVANHMKFAVGHFFAPQLPGDSFVSMISDHVAVGRMNLGASAVMLMRRLGMQAFQIPLFPSMVGSLVKELNHLPQPELIDRKLNVEPEIERALSIGEPVYADRSHRIFCVSNAFEVSLNVMEWNRSVASSDGAHLWGKRTVTFFVYDPRSQRFAPSKFCAFIPVSGMAESVDSDLNDQTLGMTMPYYCAIDANEPRFDGGVARRHFLNRLGYRLLQLGESPGLSTRFEGWLATQKDCIRIHPRRAHILIPPHLKLPA